MGTIVNNIVRKLDQEEIVLLSRDSKVVSFRWDLIEWGLVLDLDVPVSEGDRRNVYRAWLVFVGVSEINIPLHFSRLPNGCFLSSPISIKQQLNGFSDYSFNALLPEYDDSNQVLYPVTKSICIRAKEIQAVSSIKTELVNEFGFLPRKIRSGLATDDEMLTCL